jgi:hypothetical protein
MNIETVDLNSRNLILPSDSVGVVIAQPYVSDPEGEPFRWVDGRRDAQLALIRRTLDIAKAATHGAGKTHFTIFPEYSIPGLEGIAVINEALSEDAWPIGTVVIGGTEGLSPDDYRVLAQRDHTCHHETNSPDKVAQDEWVNCGVIWVKSARDRIERWLQPKAAPAVPEWDTRYQHMFAGKATFVFLAKFQNGSPCLFFSLICFDWIARENGQRLWQSVLHGIEGGLEVGDDGNYPISWAFVIELNSAPNHPAFIQSAATFFQSENEFARTPRAHGCLVFANCAGRAQPGRVTRYGFSGLVFSGDARFTLPDCHPTYASRGKLLRKVNGLGECKDILFREFGACIHSFSQNISAFAPGGVEGRQPPIFGACVYPVTEDAEDPRTPSAAVPASIKFLNDMLDESECLSRTYPQVALAGHIAQEHTRNVEELRHIDGHRAEQCVCRASCESNVAAGEHEKRRCKPPDCWSGPEQMGVEHVVHSLDILRMAFDQVDIRNSSAHATITMRAQDVEVLAVHGKTHSDCLRNTESVFPSRGRKMLIVSRDRDNTPFFQQFGSILRAKADLNSEPSFTDLAANKVVVGYNALLSNYMGGQTHQALEESLYASFTAG